MTIKVENCTTVRANFFVILNDNCSTNCYCNFNLCGIFEKFTSTGFSGLITGFGSLKTGLEIAKNRFEGRKNWFLR